MCEATLIGWGSHTLRIAVSISTVLHSPTLPLLVLDKAQGHVGLIQYSLTSIDLRCKRIEFSHVIPFQTCMEGPAKM